MMKKECVEKAKLKEDSSDEEFFLEYILIEEETVVKDSFGLCLYGIEIIKRDKNGFESQEIFDVSSDRAKVLKLIRRIARNTVTPIMLLDVVYDLMYEEEESESAKGGTCCGGRREMFAAAVL